LHPSRKLKGNMRTEKEELIIKLHKEGKTWDEIAHAANASPNTISRLSDEYDQCEAFKLFQLNFSPIQVRIKLSLSPDKVKKHYLAFRELHNLSELSSVCNELGQNIPDFLGFYKGARSFNITPQNMFHALDLARNIEYMKQENNGEYARLMEARRISAQEATNLAESQNQIRITGYNLSTMRTELGLLKSAIDKIKNSPNYRQLENIIFQAVNSFGSEKDFPLQAAVIAVMRTIQKDPAVVPLLQYPYLDKLDLANTLFNQYILTAIINKVTELMPEVREVLADLVNNRILPELSNLTLVDELDSGLQGQSNSESSRIIQQEVKMVTELKETSDLAKYISPPQEKGGKSIDMSSPSGLNHQQYESDEWDDFLLYYGVGL
jgi:hypothetical protein